MISLVDTRKYKNNRTFTAKNLLPNANAALLPTSKVSMTASLAKSVQRNNVKRRKSTESVLSRSDFKPTEIKKSSVKKMRLSEQQRTSSCSTDQDSHCAHNEVAHNLRNLENKIGTQQTDSQQFLCLAPFLLISFPFSPPQLSPPYTHQFPSTAPTANNVNRTNITSGALSCKITKDLYMKPDAKHVQLKIERDHQTEEDLKITEAPRKTPKDE